MKPAWKIVQNGGLLILVLFDPVFVHDVFAKNGILGRDRGHLERRTLVSTVGRKEV